MIENFIIQLNVDFLEPVVHGYMIYFLAKIPLKIRIRFFPTRSASDNYMIKVQNAKR